MHFSLRCRFALLAGAIVNGSILEPKRSPRRANSTKQLGGSQDDSPFFDNLIDPQPLLLREKSSDILAGGTGSSNPLRSTGSLRAENAFGAAVKTRPATSCPTAGFPNPRLECRFSNPAARRGVSRHKANSPET